MLSGWIRNLFIYLLCQIKSTFLISGNIDALKNLKNWLETWMNFSKEIISKKKRRNDDSSSEFESTDCDSRDSTRLPGNTMVLGGPCGSGKSAAVYAICHELGFNVIEINASSKRTGMLCISNLKFLLLCGIFALNVSKKFELQPRKICLSKPKTPKNQIFWKKFSQ